MTCSDCGRICYERGRARVIEAARTMARRSPADEFLRMLAGGGRANLRRLADIMVRFEDMARLGTLPIPRELNELRGGIWEIKAGNVRLPFFDVDRLPITELRVTSGFLKRQERTPRREIDRAEWVRREDLQR
jgi:hypothetical protein